MNLKFSIRALLIILFYLNLTQLVWPWNVTFNLNLLCKFGKLVKVQELNWFISQQMNTRNSNGVQELIISLQRCLALTQTIFNNCTDTFFMQSESKKNSLSVVFITSPTDPIFGVYDRTMKAHHIYFGLLIMVNEVNDFHIAEQFLLRLYKHHFHDTLLYYHSTKNQSNELFAYNCFPEFKFENRTDFFDFLQRTMPKRFNGGMDTEGYKLYSPLRKDLLQVFSYRDNGSWIVYQGVTYRLLKSFAAYINASLVKYDMPKDRLGGDVIDMKAALELVRNGKIMLLAHAYTLYHANDELSKSYPLLVENYCLMVPVRNSISTLYYPMKPFSELIWFGVVGVFFALVTIKFLRCCCRGTHGLAMRLCDGILYCFCLSIGIGAPRLMPNAPSVVDFIIFACFFFYGFFLTANYTSLLGSIFTVNLFHQQINTMDDLIRANISVMIIDYELEFLRSNADSFILPENFSRIILPVDAATFDKHQVELNTSYAYFITDNKWDMVEMQQEYLKQKIFKFTDICFGSYHLTYPMQPNSPFYRSLEYFIYRMHSSGMLFHFFSTSFDQAVSAGLIKRLADNSDFIAAGLQHLVIVFIMLLVMCGISCIVFVGELLAYQLMRKRSIKFNLVD